MRAQQSLPTAIKKIFATPTPAPARKKRKASASATASPKPKHGGSPSPAETATPEPTATGSAKSKRHKKSSPTATPTASATATTTAAPSETPEPSATASPKSKRHKKSSPTPTPSPSATGTPPPAPSETASPSASVSASPGAKQKGAPATIAREQIAGYDGYAPNVRKLTDQALDLTTRNLSYKYGSADPANGGMDCSGFVYYVLTQNGVPDVPRDSSQQYVWARKAGTFRAVNSRKDDTFELDELVPGDLLFWTGTYSIERDPPITHAMIYLGREKGSNKRIMIGASDGRVYQGESRYGVSVFDFKIAHPPRDNDAKLTPSFIGYAHIPGLR
ncbi:MAG: C40 family peptidase [Chthoniobacterales bacterium]